MEDLLFSESNESTDMSKNIQCAKADKGKLPISLVPMEIIRNIAAIRKYGEEKYHAPNNWVLVDKKRYIDELLAQGILSFINSKNKGIFEEVLY